MESIYLVARLKKSNEPMAQVEAARKIYSGPHNHSGQLLFPGYEPGGEVAGGWSSWISGTSPAAPPADGALQAVLGYGFTCDLFLGVTTCNYLGVDVDKQDAITRKTLQPILSSVNPDLRPFKGQGGKMIQYAGWNDTAIAPENRSEEHTSELQSLRHLVCRLLLEKKKQT